MTEVVVITGASAGVGRATARLFAARGAPVALLARGKERLRAAQKEIERLGGTALALNVDVANAGQVEDAAEEIETKLGPIGVWINNAMASVFSPVIETTPAEYRRVTEVTYLGYVYGTLAALRRMKPRDHGKIVQVGSALAYRAIPLQSAYCAAKHAIQGFNESLRSELLHDKSRVSLTMVQLPAVNTPQFGWVKSRLPNKARPVPPIYQPERIAKAIYWAARHHRRETWVGMPTVKAMLVDKFAPGFGDRYLARYGYESQQTQVPEQPGRLDNLWSPVPGPYGAHGRFDARAKNHSAQIWASEHRWLTLAAAAGAAAFIARVTPRLVA